MKSRLAVSSLILVAASLGVVTLSADEAARGKAKAAPPAVGDEAPDFELRSPAGEKVKLSSLTEKGPVVLVVLRGFPGYQCPVCTKQVAQLIERAIRFKDARAHVVLIYPGSATKLDERAREFVGKQQLPDHFQLLIDPDYTFTNAWHLRWDAKNETAYPATFIVDTERRVRFAKISNSHGDRSDADKVLEALQMK